MVLQQARSFVVAKKLLTTLCAGGALVYLVKEFNANMHPVVE